MCFLATTISSNSYPSCLEMLELIGVREKIKVWSFQCKGGEYLWGKDLWILNFALLHHPYSFQVVRSEFDHFRLEHTKSQVVINRQVGANL